MYLTTPQEALKVDDLEEKLRLFESSVTHLWVKWDEPETIHVIDCSQGSFLPKGSYKLADLIDENELSSIKVYHRTLSEIVSVKEFYLKYQSKKTRISCSSKKINNETICLWVVVPEVDHTTKYLQNAAHDIKAPLGSILSIVNLMHHQLSDEGPINEQEVKTFLDMIKLSGSKALHIANEVLELAEMESPGYQLKTEKVTFSDFIAQYIKTHRLLAIKKQIKIHFESKSTAMVEINEAKMTRVLDNIMSNAIKFSQENSNIDVEIVEEGDKLELLIKDRGIGMNSEILEHIFVKFGKSRRKGLDGETPHGLGMSIVKQIMLLHRGDVRVKSQENEGTQVSLFFNIAS